METLTSALDKLPDMVAPSTRKGGDLREEAQERLLGPGMSDGPACTHARARARLEFVDLAQARV